MLSTDHTTLSDESLPMSIFIALKIENGISGGIDPSADKKVKARSAQITFEAVAREWHENQTPIWTDG